MEAFSLLLILLSLLLLFLLHHRLHFRLPPGPRPWPIVGNIYDVKPVRFSCFADWAQTYGPIISVWFGSELNIVVSNSELAKQVLKDNDHRLANRSRSRLRERFSRGGKDLIWADYGSHYVKRLEALRPIREDEVTAMVESIYKHCTDKLGKSVEIRKYLGSVAFNNITRLAFGKRFEDADGTMDEQGQEFKAIGANGIKIGSSVSISEHIPWLRPFFPLNEEAIAKHGARRDRLTQNIMEEHMRAHQESGGAKQHFFDALLTLREQYDLSEDTIIGLLWDMMAAGTDTTAIAVEWAMAELVKNPRVQQKAQEELDRVIGHDRVITEIDFPNLPYLQAITKESLRLHPPTPLMLPHKASSKVTIGGYDVPKDSVVHVNVWAIARDPDIWKNPLEFRPERFLEDDVDMKGADFRLLPFGAGRRVCPGAQLGINLVTSKIAHLLHHFSWEAPNGMSPDEIDMGARPGTVTYMRSPLEVVPTPRLPSNPSLYKRIGLNV